MFSPEKPLLAFPFLILSYAMSFITPACFLIHCHALFALPASFLRALSIILRRCRLLCHFMRFRHYLPHAFAAAMLRCHFRRFSAVFHAAIILPDADAPPLLRHFAFRFDPARRHYFRRYFIRCRQRYADAFATPPPLALCAAFRRYAIISFAFSIFALPLIRFILLFDIFLFFRHFRCAAIFDYRHAMLCYAIAIAGFDFSISYFISLHYAAFAFAIFAIFSPPCCHYFAAIIF